jgi:hypothetical protein
MDERIYRLMSKLNISRFLPQLEFHRRLFEMNINKAQVFIGMFFILYSSLTISQTKVELTESEKIMRSMTQLTGALSLNKGLKEDKLCSKINFNPIPIDQYINAFIELEKKDGKASTATPEKLSEIKDMLTKLPYAQIPNQGIMWKAQYDSFTKEVISRSNLSGDSLCNYVNNASNNLFKRSMDTLK